jgi:hypothetical protein
MTEFRPLFVFGIARSGTNLLAGMLSARHDVYLALDPLLPFFKALQRALVLRTGDIALVKRYTESSAFQDGYFDATGRKLLDAVLSGDLNIALASSQAETLPRSISARAALESSELSARIAAVRGGTFDELLHDLLVRIAAQSTRSLAWCGTKEVWTTDFIPLLARALPDARFVVIRRDPRAILASLIAMMRSDPSQAAHTISYMRHWRKEAALVELLAADPLLAGRLQVVRYEILATEPGATAKQLCNFLDLPFHDCMLAPVGPDGAVSFGNSSFGTIDGVATTSIDRWRSVLDPGMVKTIECHCGPEMLAEGYELVNPPPVRPDATVARIVAEADRDPGLWRSDSGDPVADLAHEARRWTMLQKARKDMSEAAIREHFLFGSYFKKLVAFVTCWELAVPARSIGCG